MPLSRKQQKSNDEFVHKVRNDLFERYNQAPEERESMDPEKAKAKFHETLNELKDRTEQAKEESKNPSKATLALKKFCTPKMSAPGEPYSYSTTYTHKTKQNLKFKLEAEDFKAILTTPLEIIEEIEDEGVYEDEVIPETEVIDEHKMQYSNGDQIHMKIELTKSSNNLDNALHTYDTIIEEANLNGIPTRRFLGDVRTSRCQDCGPGSSLKSDLHDTIIKKVRTIDTSIKKLLNDAETSKCGDCDSDGTRYRARLFKVGYEAVKFDDMYLRVEYGLYSLSRPSDKTIIKFMEDVNFINKSLKLTFL